MTESAKTRVLLYARVSTKAQAKDDKTSLGRQLDFCREYAERRGWEAVAEITDDASGYTLDRPGLHRARAMAQQGGFDVFLSWTQQRRSRSQDDTSELDRELRRVGVRVETVEEGSVEDSPMGRFRRDAQSFVAESDRDMRTKATSGGQRAKVQSGRVLGSSPRAKYGYRFVTVTKPSGAPVRVGYEPDSEEAATVRWLFEQTVAGATTRQLARMLNERGVPTPYGGDERYHTSGQWSSQAVRKLLRSEHYKGGAHGLVNKRNPVAKGNRYSSIVHDTKNAVWLDESVVPALVDADIWNRAQEILTTRTLRPTHAARSADVWLRGGLAVCGVCGGTLILAHKPGKSPYLKCTRSGREAAACGKPSPTITADKLQGAVWPLLRSVLRDPYLLFDRFESSEQTAHDGDRLVEAGARLVSVEQRRRNLLRRLELLTDDELQELRPRLDELADERDGLKRQIAALERRIANRSAERDRVNRLAAWVAEEQGRIDRMSAAEIHGAARRLGLTVRVYPSSAPDRFLVELGAYPDEAGFFADLDLDNITGPTAEQRRETARLESEAAERGYGAEQVERLLVGSANERYSLMYR